MALNVASSSKLERFYEGTGDYNVGVNLNYYIHKYRLNPEISVLWNSIKYRSQSLGYTTKPKIVDVNSKFIEIPLGVGVRIINKKIFNLDLSFGFSYGKLILSKDISCNIKCNTSETYTNKSIFSTYTGLKTSFIFKNKMFFSSKFLLNTYYNGFDYVEQHKALVYSLNVGFGTAL
jgi:hypothetical protein